MKNQQSTQATSMIAQCLFLLTMGVFAVSGPVAAAPHINLFPTTVLEDIRHTGDIAKEMESGLQELIQQLDQQQQIFEGSKCEGADEDQGCLQLKKQLNANYMKMLDIMSVNLPAMEEAVESTRVNLEKRIRRELGQKMSSWDLQEALLGKSPHPEKAMRPVLRGQSGMRLSDRFGQYYGLVANAGANLDDSLMVIAADIYLDMQDTAGLIARTQDEIARATLMGKLNQSFGAISPQMQAVVSGVKSILFGDNQGQQSLASPPRASTPQGYISPLEL